MTVISRHSKTTLAVRGTTMTADYGQQPIVVFRGYGFLSWELSSWVMNLADHNIKSWD